VLIVEQLNYSDFLLLVRKHEKLWRLYIWKN